MPTAPGAVGTDEPPQGQTMEAFLASNGPTRPGGTREADKMIVHVIDIGQGLSVLLEFPCGAILLDTGGEEDPQFHSTQVLHSYLDDFFARRTDLHRTLDGLFISHPHLDHTRGIDMVRDSYRIRNVVTNGQERDDEGGQPQMALQSWVIQHNRHEKPAIGLARVDVDQIPTGGLVNEVIDPVHGCDASPIDPAITLLWGHVTGRPGYPDNPNDHSLVFRVQFGASSILLTGDLERAGQDAMGHKYEDRPDLLDVDVYMVGHHGSRNATAPHLMRSMSPKIALISAGPYERDFDWTARRFGHPNIRAIDELRNPQYGVSWYRDSRNVWVGVSGAWEDRKSVFTHTTINRAIYATAWDGNIDLRMYGNGWLEVDTQRGHDTPVAATN